MPLDYRLPLTSTAGVEMNKWDITGPLLRGQQLRESKMKEKAYLRDLQDKEKIKSILANSKKSDGAVDFDKASSELEKNGFIDQADTIRKYSMEKSNFDGLRRFQKNLQDGISQPDMTEMVENPDYDPNLKLELNQLDQLRSNPFVASPDYVRNANKNPMEFGPQLPVTPKYELNLENLSTNQRNAPGATDQFAVDIKGEESSLSKLNSLADLYANRTPEFISKIVKQPSKPYSFQEGVDMFMKEVPFKDEESASRYMKLLDPKENVSETERKEKIVDEAMNFVFSDDPKGNQTYQSALSEYNKEGAESKQRAQSLMISTINGTSIPGSIKGLLIDRVRKNFPVPESTMAEQVQKGMMAYDAIRVPKMRDELALASEKQKLKAGEDASKDLKSRTEKYGESKAKTVESDTRIRDIKKLVDKGVYSKLATLETSKWPTLMRLPADVLIAQGLSEDEINLKNNVVGFRNALLKERSGGAVTDPEQLRLVNELESNLMSTPDQFKKAMDNIYEISRLREETRVGTYGQDAIDLFHSRIPGESGSNNPSNTKVRRKFNPATGEIE